MPIYDFKCKKCDTVCRDVMLPITHLPAEKPRCCDELMNYYITSPPMVLWTDPIIEPFRPVATKDAPVISSMREHREYMARNGLVDANDLYEPPTHTEEHEINKQSQATIDAITPTAEQEQQLKDSGINSIID